MVHASLAHKSDVGALALNLKSTKEVEEAVASISASVKKLQPKAANDLFLVEAMVAKPVAELLASVRQDPEFGWALTLASGGILTELLNDAVTLLLPATESDFERAISKLKISKLLNGYRGQAKADVRALLSTIVKLQTLALSQEKALQEIEINPLFILEEGCYAVDALVQIQD